MQVQFVFEKATKNAWRYRAANAVVIPGYNTLYIAQIAGREPPTRLEVNIVIPATES